MALFPGLSYVHRIDTLLVLVDGTPITDFQLDSPAVETSQVDDISEAVRGLRGCWAPVRNAPPRRRIRITLLPLSTSDGLMHRVVTAAGARGTPFRIQILFGQILTSAIRTALASSLAASGSLASTPASASGLWVGGYAVLVSEPERTVHTTQIIPATWEFEGMFPTYSIGALVPARPITATEIEAFSKLQGLVG